MKTYLNRINGKDYLYAYDTIVIAKGKTVQKRKSLGPVEPRANTAKRMRGFLESVIKEEAELRSDYWGKRIQSKKFAKYVPIEKIEGLRSTFGRAKENMGAGGSTAMEIAFMADFIYNSNRIEGSKMPRESVEREVRGGFEKNDEVGNTIKAVTFTNNKFRFSVRGIEKLHDILLAHEPSHRGFRKDRVVVGKSEVADWKGVKPRLLELLEWIEKSKRAWYPPELAFAFYYKFERIHPFSDGNGRTGRLIMNKILKDQGYHPMVIWNKNRQAHLTAFESYLRGKEETYFKFMADQLIKTHEVYIEKIQKAFDLEKQINYFLEPSERTAD
jgi:prophage maintenance system killer protein